MAITTRDKPKSLWPGIGAFSKGLYEAAIPTNPKFDYFMGLEVHADPDSITLLDRGSGRVFRYIATDNKQISTINMPVESSTYTVADILKIVSKELWENK